MTIAEVQAVLSALLAPGARLHDAIEAADPPTEVLPGRAWQAYVWPKASASAALLRVYRVGDGSSVLAAIWRNEVRTLLRLSRRNFPALPRIRDAWADPTTGFSYLLMEDPGMALHLQPAAVEFLADRAHAFQAFATLTEALALLHANGVIHRAVTADAVRGHLDTMLAVKLDQFQFSSMVAAWLRSGASPGAEASAWLAAMSPSALVALPPERLGPLFGEPIRHLESFSGDVFGLGFLAASWLVGGPSEDDCAHVFAGGRFSQTEHVAVITALRQRVQTASLPRPLALLLASMLEPIAAHRPTSALSVAELLRGSYGAILAQLELRQEEAQPYSLWFMRPTVERFYFRYRATLTHPDRMNEQEYADLLAQDLEGGEVCWSPDGFLPWTDERDEEARRRCAEARVLLVGRRFACFCQFFKEREGAVENDRVLLLKYPCERQQVAEHIATIPRRAAPPIRAKFFVPGTHVRIPASRPWKPLVEPVRYDKTTDDAADPVVAANWLVSIQQGRLDAQAYDYTLVPSALPDIVLRGEWRRSGSLESAADAFEELARRSGLVGEMGDYFEELARRAESADEDSPAFILGDSSGRDAGIRLEFMRKEDARTVRFRPRNGVPVPPSGRIWADQGAQRQLLARQRRAARSLSTNLDLVNQLRSPRSLDLAMPQAPYAGLAPETSALLARIDGAWPMFCVQGPPGTGKTFMSSLAVGSALAREPLTRVLVSAQAHHALDNLLDGILERLGPDAPLMVRLAGQDARRKVSAAGAARFPDALTGQLRTKAQSVPLPAEPALRAILGSWRGAAKDGKLDLELSSRVTRSAAVVFTTCAGAGARALPSDLTFDLVVLEEAARGWLSEILVPLVRGDRWLLVGDQRQLPAFEAQRLRRALATDIDQQVTAASGGPPVAARLVPYLTYFGHLMETAVAPPVPREMLSTQHRMHPEISSLVSTTFYEGKVKDAAGVHRRHGLAAPWLSADQGFLWIDTSSLGRVAWESDGALRNELEVKLVTFLANRLAPFPEHDSGIRPAIVLCPYLKQLEALQNRVQRIDRGDILSVDSFQGGQAEVVITSLVRNNSFDGPSSGIGFLAEPERVNVLMSRARRLLIVVGSLAHFERFTGTFWTELSRQVRATPGALVDVASIGFQVR